MAKENDDIYAHKYRLEMENKRVEDANISNRNKELIKTFQNKCFSEGLSLTRTIKYTQHLRQFSEWTKKDLDKTTRSDIEELVTKIGNMNYIKKCKGKEIYSRSFSEATKQGFSITLKKYYKVMEGNGEFYPDKIKWINTKLKNGSNIKLPEDILNEEDIRTMLENARNLRDKCLISVLADSGMRISELMSVQLKHVKFNEDKTAEILANISKTKPRRVLLIPSLPYLANWYENHPSRSDREAYLFIGLGAKNYGRRMKHCTIDTMLRKIAIRAGIKKRYSCHQFRHFAATQAASFMTQAQMNERFGWVQGSKMGSTYIHLSGRDVDNTYKERYGINSIEEFKESKLNPKTCHICNNLCKPESDFCNKCGSPLNLKAGMNSKKAEIEIKEVFKLALDNPEKSFAEIMDKFRKTSS